jgi:beta-1,2-mannobiose phosphorylase / 1,2-beta-oligomannan phosphorylase
LNNNYLNVEGIVAGMDVDPSTLTREKQLLIGSFFTMEFSIESAAFFNPSIVEDPDQTGLRDGEKRVIASFRATGEGHISSLVFRSGIIDKNNDLQFRPSGDLLDIPETVKKHIYQKEDFIQKLSEMDVQMDLLKIVTDRLEINFTYEELQENINAVLKKEDLSTIQKKVIKDCNWLANSYYEITFSLDTAISERVIFPIADTERNGIEDARFVKFTDERGLVSYYATYTAYNGYSILPKLIETKDFYHFKVMPLNGKYAQNKGMALFPQKINNQFAMIARLDGVNNYIMYSDDIHYWHKAKMFEKPTHPWQFVQIGNCGSPLKTEAGWLLLTHGVGPMRAYSVGATLLDLDDPSKAIGSLREPLMKPNEDEREGYVPNVIYSCGAMIHNNELLIAYAMADYASSFAFVSLDDLLENLTS